MPMPMASRRWLNCCRSGSSRGGSFSLTIGNAIAPFRDTGPDLAWPIEQGNGNLTINLLICHAGGESRLVYSGEFRMMFQATYRATLSALAIAAAVGALPSAASAQDMPPLPMPMNEDEVSALPSDLRTGPVVREFSETTVDANGVETITRTRRIESTVPAYAGHSAEYQGHSGQGYPVQGYAHGYAPAYGYAGYAPGAQVFERDQWIAECERRTSGRSGREKGGIIGGLLGAIAGGFIGNEVARAGERLGSTLIGVGVGGIGGALLGSLIGGGRNDRGDYDCEAALDSYLSQYGQPGARIAARTIPAPVYAAPAYPAYGYGYAPAYQSYGYSYAPPQQIVYVPIEYQQQQRVIVRETVREEIIPGARRTIPAPAPVPRPVPRPIKGEPVYIKGN